MNLAKNPVYGRRKCLKFRCDSLCGFLRGFLREIRETKDIHKIFGHNIFIS